MNKVDIYVNDVRLDIFQDEEISINLSVQNVQDISKVFTDFTQAFTVPASTTNNGVFSYYYRNDVVGGFDGRLRAEARIEINSLPFRTGVVELENVQLKGTEPYAYTLTFYGDVVTLTDLFGEDYLYDLDFSTYDHDYNDEAIYDRLTTDIHAPLFYPLMSPVKNWFYQSEGGAGADNENNIAYRTGGGGEGGQGRRGINYYEFKPALKVYAIIEAIGAKYGITFPSEFVNSVPFVDLSLWLHRKEGYMYENQPNAATYKKIDFQTRTGTYFNLDNDTFDLTSLGVYSFSFFVNNLNVEANVALFVNGAYRSSFVLPTSAVGTTITSQFFFAAAGDRLSLRIKSNQNSTALTYRFTSWAMDLFPSTSLGSASMSSTATISTLVRVSELMPEIKVKDFLAGILKMYNMVIVPTTSTSFLLQPLDDWYAAGTDKDYQEYLDITEYVVNRPPLYKEIEFKYQPTEQILGYQYQQTNNVGFGDLNVDFTFDGEELLIDVPFECPLYERLTDLHTDALTNVLVYKSITSETNEAGIFNPYLGAPILFYGYFDDYDLTANPVGYVNADKSHRVVNIAWYANTSNRYASAGASHSICFGADIDPFHLQSVNRSLYYTEWSNYITDLYSSQRRVYNVEAVLPIGKIIALNLQNAIIWNGTKYIINNVSLNMTTGKAKFELLNVV